MQGGASQFAIADLRFAILNLQSAIGRWAFFSSLLVYCFRNALTVFHPPSPWMGEGTGEGVKALEPPVSWPPHPRPLPQGGRGNFREERAVKVFR